MDPLRTLRPKPGQVELPAGAETIRHLERIALDFPGLLAMGSVLHLNQHLSVTYLCVPGGDARRGTEEQFGDALGTLPCCLSMSSLPPPC